MNRMIKPPKICDFCDNEKSKPTYYLSLTTTKPEEDREDVESFIICHSCFYSIELFSEL